MTKVLRDYTEIPGLSCGVCGANHMLIEATDDPDVVALRCWCDSRCLAPVDDPSIRRVLGAKADGPDFFELAESLEPSSAPERESWQQVRDTLRAPRHWSPLRRGFYYGVLGTSAVLILATIIALSAIK